MNFYKTTNPDDYGLYFYKQIGLNCTFEQPHEQIWTNPDVGTIHIYGSLDEIQCGTGDYTIPTDLLAEFDYESAFLHFGIICFLCNLLFCPGRRFLKWETYSDRNRHAGILKCFDFLDAVKGFGI